LSGGRFEVAGLAPSELARLRKADWPPERWQELFAVRVAAVDAPAMVGAYRIAGAVLRFEPRFPLVPGVRYRAVFRPSRLLESGGGEDVTAEFELPKARPAQPTVITRVYPTSDRLPENQLKFYLHFSAPMSRGEAYRRVRLLDEAGQPVELPFLELDQELWDPAAKRFTLFFDPGRIKRGLKPREEFGPVLVEGKRYTLVIDRQWPDAAGNPLRETYRKRFRVLAPDDRPPDPKSWKLKPPAAGGTEPLIVRLGEPLDRALLERLLFITDPEGRRLAGAIRVTQKETRWLFSPKRPWRAGRYELVVDTTLEDLAGNSVGRPFEVDLFRPIGRFVEQSTVTRAFRVR
jgi:hypothetical protein